MGHAVVATATTMTVNISSVITGNLIIGQVAETRARQRGTTRRVHLSRNKSACTTRTPTRNEAGRVSRCSTSGTHESSRITVVYAAHVSSPFIRVSPDGVWRSQTRWVDAFDHDRSQIGVPKPNEEARSSGHLFLLHISSNSFCFSSSPRSSSVELWSRW